MWGFYVIFRARIRFSRWAWLLYLTPVELSQSTGFRAGQRDASTPQRLRYEKQLLRSAHKLRNLISKAAVTLYTYRFDFLTEIRDEIAICRSCPCCLVCLPTFFLHAGFRCKAAGGPYFAEEQEICEEG